MNTLRTSALLSAAGGFLDSFAYVAHGHVFTNAQTGNVVLCAVSAAQGSWPQALRQAKVFATICAAFAFGAIMGAVLTVAFEPVAMVVPIALLVLALLSCLGEARRPPAESV